jgi:YfiH family protein
VPDADRVPLLWWDAAGEAARASVAVTTRQGGVSAPPYDTLNLGLHVGDRTGDVAINRARAAAAFGVPVDTMVFARQVHGTTAALIGPEDLGRGTSSEDDAVADTDILVTSSPGVTLAVLVADCVPIALVDPAAHVLAAVHAGWRGTAGAAVAVALRAMADRGARPERVLAYLGPAVDPRRYQVTDLVRHALAAAVHPAPLARDVARPDGPGHWLVDLVAANHQQLLDGGVTPEHVTHAGLTTADTELFSDRAARPCGRFGLLARLLG